MRLFFCGLIPKDGGRVEFARLDTELLVLWFEFIPHNCIDFLITVNLFLNVVKKTYRYNFKRLLKPSKFLLSFIFVSKLHQGYSLCVQEVARA